MKNLPYTITAVAIIAVVAIAAAPRSAATLSALELANAAAAVAQANAAALETVKADMESQTKVLEGLERLRNKLKSIADRPDADDKAKAEFAEAEVASKNASKEMWELVKQKVAHIRAASAYAKEAADQYERAKAEK